MHSPTKSTGRSLGTTNAGQTEDSVENARSNTINKVCAEKFEDTIALDFTVLAGGNGGIDVRFGVLAIGDGELFTSSAVIEVQLVALVPLEVSSVLSRCGSAENAWRDRVVAYVQRNVMRIAIQYLPDKTTTHEGPREHILQEESGYQEWG